MYSRPRPGVYDDVLPASHLVSYDGHWAMLGAGGDHCGDQAQPPGAAPGHKHRQMAPDTRGASASHQAHTIISISSQYSRKFDIKPR